MSDPDQITPHFHAREFRCRDGTDYPLDREEIDGRPWRQTRLLRLCSTLEVIRYAGGEAPISITSGYRSLAHNRKIGSRDTSQHVKGRAADITHPHMTADDLHELIDRLWRAGSLPWLGGLGLYPSFVHVDVRPRPEDDHVARWTGGRTGS